MFKSLFLSWKPSHLHSIRTGLSLAKQLMLPQKMYVSSAKFTSLIFWWSPFCTLLVPCHYHQNGRQSWLQQQRETWRVGNPAKVSPWRGQRGQRKDHLLLFLDWILFCTIHIRQVKLPWKSWKGNKKFQATVSIALHSISPPSPFGWGRGNNPQSQIWKRGDKKKWVPRGS